MVYGVTWLLCTHTIEGGDLKFTLITFKLCFEVIKEKTEEGDRIITVMRTVPYRTQFVIAGSRSDL
jgi:hypothetical protein